MGYSFITMEYIHVQSMLGYKINPVFNRAAFSFSNRAVFYDYIN